MPSLSRVTRLGDISSFGLLSKTLVNFGGIYGLLKIFQEFRRGLM
jgi:hypothetical protein